MITISNTTIRIAYDRNEVEAATIEKDVLVQSGFRLIAECPPTGDDELGYFDLSKGCAKRGAENRRCPFYKRAVRAILGKKNMKRMKINLLLLLLSAVAIFQELPAQTLTITSTAVEVISAGAKSRAFYAIDDCYFQNTASGGFVVRDAANGTIIFSGDTSEVDILDAGTWADAQDNLDGLMMRIPFDGSFEDSGDYPFYFLPKKRVNFLYKNGTGIVTAVQSQTKNQLWSGSYSRLVDGENASNTLSWIRNVLFHDGQRAGEVFGPSATVAVDTAAGTSPEIEIQSRGGDGKIILHTGSSTKATGVICTVTLPVSYDVMFVNLTGRTATSQAHITRVYPEQTADNVFKLIATGTALTADTDYVFDFTVSGYNDTPAD